jgi:hypothetical protein
MGKDMGKERVRKQVGYMGKGMGKRQTTTKGKERDIVVETMKN